MQNQEEKLNKYVRNRLMDLIGKTDDKPIVLFGRYKYYNGSSDWETLINVRPYINEYRTHVICGHLNIKRDEALKYMTLNEEYDRKKFFMIGYPYTYNHYGIERGCLKLARPESIGGYSPVLHPNDFIKNEDEIMKYVFPMNNLGYEGAKRYIKFTSYLKEEK